MSRAVAAVLAVTLAVAASAQTPPVSYNPAVTFEPFHRSGVYAAGETVGWTLRAPLGLGPQRFRYVIRENNMAVLDTGTIDLKSGVGTIRSRLDHPGMLSVRLTPLEGGEPIDTSQLTAQERDRLTVAAAVAPLSLKPGAARPVDFDAFWAGKLAELGRIPINPVLEPAVTAEPGVALSTVTLDSVGGHVRGYLAAPTKAGKYPALVIFQYAGVYPLVPETATARAAEGWLTFNVDSHDMAPTEATAPRNYAQVGAESRETSYFLNMYLRDTRALDYIRSRPDWDGRTIVLMGTSMGGQQSLVTAGLNPDRVTAVLVNVPSGALTNGDLHGAKAGYPNWDVSNPAIARAALYFDPVNFASRIRAPVLAGVGFLDEVSPPVGIFTALAQIPGAKEPVAMIESDHNHITPQKEGDYYRRSREVLDEIRRTGRFVPRRDWTEPQP
ncbi:acetylxylan esterase [Sphingomonas quercus]|uniref:Acetylxylan esterase n=1 Tax=Sphingomonas quercus TaxID=2842451 RepID=A0ABS6BHT8_9SPHN|nr:acetylxylan esterase [Sphingomonas quercus]MBU3077366.1 acetylxylan esterase [Sphingomonas quercus]